MSRKLVKSKFEEARKRNDKFMLAGGDAFVAGAPEYIRWFFQREQSRKNDNSFSAFDDGDLS
jgi:hypothetical protein